MRLRHRLVQKTTLEQHLLLEQRLSIRNELFARRLALLEALGVERWTPHAECPRCGYALTPAEILDGFLDDPRDFSTKCPRCTSRRFPAQLSLPSDAGSTTLIFYCAIQVQSMLRAAKKFSPEAIEQLNPSLYRSALIHFGSMANAFKTIGVSVSTSEKTAWRAKVLPFLGTMPDTHIARIVGKSPSAIRKLRYEHDIDAFVFRNVLDDLDA